VNCPVCKKEAHAHIVKCATCGAYVHETCWDKHVQEAHKE
jgi:hypothetical protein